MHKIASLLLLASLVAAACASDETPQSHANSGGAPAAAEAKAPAATLAAVKAAPGIPHQSTYALRQNLKIKDIPAGAKSLRVWFFLPSDDASQEVTDIDVQAAPAGYEIVGDHVHGERVLYAEVANPAAGEVKLAVETRLRRCELLARGGAADTAPLTEDHRQAFAEHLRTDVPHMEVDARVRKIAADVCGDETNVLVQARRLYDYVVDTTEHYSKKTVQPSTIGSLTYCLDNKGGSCTDMHSLFIALCRAREIPARLVFGTRLKAENNGKEVDPGYRCWAYVFAPRLGWVPVECAAGDTVKDKKDYYFGNLDDRRVCWVEGRNRSLSPAQSAGAVNVINRAAYVEVDGRPHAAFDFTVLAEDK
jgi:transglutaminase-like putative cysteine protease